ncbi:integrase, catalytic region, zinc finger, CCHC-type containing protein, partial [Tanacetum coccineum]
ESRFRRFLDNKLEDGERMWNSIQNGPYQRPMVVDPTNPTVPILEPLSKMTKGNKKQYIADVRVMNYLLQAIPNDIYNSVDAFVDYDDEYQGGYKAILKRISLQLLMDVTRFDQDGRVDIQTKNASYGGNANKNAGRNKTQGFNAGDESNQIIQRVPQTESTPGKENVQCYNCNEKCHYARECQKPKFCDSKYFREQMLLAMKDEAGSNLSNKENDFMLDTSYGEDLEGVNYSSHVNASPPLLMRNAETIPSYDAKAVSHYSASSK